MGVSSVNWALSIKALEKSGFFDLDKGGSSEEVAALMGLVEVPDVNDGQEGQEQPKEGNGDNLAARVRHARLPY
jgi:hypothetical protein